MKHIFTFLFLSFWLVYTPGIAQKESAKSYTADVSGTDLVKTKRRNDQMFFLAKKQIRGLQNLFYALTADSLIETERNSVIQNSYLPNPERLFYNDGVMIEDDINPKHTSADNSVDLEVERYLRDIDLFYSKSIEPTITFSQIVTSTVVEGKEYPYIKVFFTSTFKGKHTQFEIPYQSIQRVAELRADSVDGKLQMFITRIGFPQLGEGLTQLWKPTVTKNVGPKQRIKGELIHFRQLDSPADTLTLKLDAKWLNVLQSSVEIVPWGFYQRGRSTIKSQNTVNIELSNYDNQLSFSRIDGSTIKFISIDDILRLKKTKRQYQTKGWAQIAVGVIALGASYAGYNSIRSSHNTYINKLTSLNAEYAIWQTLTQQPGDNPASHIAFNSYASPGIYAVYGGTFAGSGLILNGIRSLLKAGKIKGQSKKHGSK